MFLRALLLGSVTVPLVGQSVTATAQTDLVVSTSLASWTPQTLRVLAGQPASDLFSFRGAAAEVSSRLMHSKYETSSLVSFTVSESARITVPGGQAAIGVHDRLLTFSGIGNAVARLEVVWDVVAPPGTPLPLLQVDVGNNGTIELTGTRPGGLQLSQRAPATPFVVLVRTGALLATQGDLVNHVDVRLVPDDPIQVAPTQLACGGGDLRAGLHFGRLLFLATDSGLVLGPADLQVLAIGFTRAPLLLPSGCLVLPALDLVLYAPLGFELQIPLPQPMTFHAQAAVLDLRTTSIHTSSALQVTAL